ncbi:cyclic nucleotide-binding protein [Actinoplanes sp. TBRC 11911]|uniref:cyclic nucleotide-binding protein n=1 Tax=Actinoplanes sp. TBRC 11911 TaxID=2729386 RepID=UPI00145D4043|nr:cyclic nucleotide-binding protein [Actinoplanes sp. TBRC 11911]NMO50612.1 cyclic nucleotide-binding protein [Actinoplanes sp. TBRC 11911]
MTYVDTGMNVWEALAGRAPAEPSGPVDPGLWGAVVDRLNPARARPVLRAGIEAVRLTGARGNDYIMLRSPDDGARAGYLRLTPEEWQIALLMDGGFTVTLLVAEFARIAGRLAPDQVHRVVADLAGNRMLADLPRDAFRPLREPYRKPLPPRPARGFVVRADRIITALYRAGGAAFFNRTGAVLTAVLAVLGLALFTTTWSRGSRSLFLAGGGSYLAGAILLVVLNVGVLAVYHLARALAVKHGRREVPAAGLLFSFGVPSLFVDTSDVWMAGRRARLLVSAAGPLGAVLFAGLAQLVGLALPFLAGLTFKIAFLFYLNAFFRLSPLLPLDGHYLLTDWLEIPQLRARALAWVSGRLRGRGPRWSSLDREGRLISLYGYLTVAWLAFAVALTVLVWSDRISGLATGLWHDGVFGALLFLLIVLGVAAPAAGFLLARLSRWWSGRSRRDDESLRLAALRSSDLGGLPEAALRDLAARARWEHPPTGRQIVRAGAAQAAVYVVVEGAMAARRPGDTPGTIRHRAGPGGVVGLADALTGRAAQLDWHTSGTSLLAIPAATVATVVGPLPGPPFPDRAEAEMLFADTPALADLSVDQRLALVASAHPADLEAGAPVVLHGPTHAVVVESGVIALDGGVELRRGTLVGPVGEGHPGMVAQTRTPVRLWMLPDASDLPPLVGARPPGSPMPVTSNRALRPGAPGGGMYPPLAVPAEPPLEPADPGRDAAFEKRLWWATAALLILALVLTGMSFRAGPAWAEMPTDQVRLSVDTGRITVLIGGEQVSLSAGATRYLRTSDQVVVGGDALARLTFKGGAVARLCSGSRVEIGALATGAGRHQTPSGTVKVDGGRLVADTSSTSGAYEPLKLTVSRAKGAVVNSGPAVFAVEPETATSARGTVTAVGAAVPHGGTVTADGEKVPHAGTVTAGGAAVPHAGTVSCGDAVPESSPAQAGIEAPFPADSGVPSTDVTVEPSLPPSPDATVDAPSVTLEPTAPGDPTSTRTESTVRPTRTPTRRPPTSNPTTPRQPPATTPQTTPPDTEEPTTEPPTTEPTPPETDGAQAP